MARNSGEAPVDKSLSDAWRVFGVPLRGIGFRFVSFVLAAVLLTGACVSAVVLTNSRSYLRQQALDNNLNQADLGAAFVANYIKTVEAHLLVFALRPDIRQAVLSGTATQLQSTLTQFVQIQTALDSAGIYDANGILEASSVVNATTIGQSFADRDWYQQTIALNQPYFGIPTQSRTTGSFTVPFVVPIKDDQGQIKALLTGGISLAVLSKTIANADYGPNTTATIIDLRGGGTITADIDQQLILAPLTEKDKAITMLQAGNSGAQETVNASGTKNLTGFAPVPDLPWGIIVVTPSSAALSIINTLTQRAGNYAALVVLVTLVLAVILVIGITRPLNRLLQETKEIGIGNLDIKIETAGKDEVGDLSRAFSDMTNNLKITMVSRDTLALEVTERKKAEKETRESENRYRSLFENMSNGYAYCRMFYKDGLPVDFQYISTNKAFEQQTGLKNVNGKMVSEIIPGVRESDPELFERYGKVALTGVPDFFETYVESLNMWFALSVYSPQREYFVVIFDVITERKLLEQERENYAAELTQKNAELERFTYTVSHDLKSPLVTIKTFLGYLKQDITGTDAERIEKDMVFMNGAADKMEKLLGELLEMSRIGRVVNLPVEVTFKELLQETLSLVAGNIADRDVQINVSAEDFTLFGDRSRLVEIWQNLVENAVKFIGNQPSPRIEIGIVHNEAEIIFFVRDNGIGIDPKFQSKLFNLFEKFNAKTEGTGMGLAITKRIVELYGGRIWVESQGIGFGSTFFFTLPGALKQKGERS